MASIAPSLQDSLARAAAAGRAGRANEERAILDQAVAQHPDSPHAHNARGMRALADAAAERAALEAALDIDRVHFVAHLRLAELHERLGNAALAAQHWSGVVQLVDNAGDVPPAAKEAAARGRAFLANHNAAYAVELDGALGHTIGAGEADRRFRACVDHMLGRRKVYQNDCAGVYFPFLPADEFFERRWFPWFEALEAQTPAIRQEALALLASGNEAIRPYVRQDRGTPTNKWTPLDGSLDWGACFLWEYGVRNDAVCALCPETAVALDAAPLSVIPGKAPSAFFSILRPGAHIPPHTGVTNTRAIIHLPLVVPEGCTFRVGGETRAWREGEAFAFDDTIEHEARNPSNEPRIVLIFDVWNPHLTEAEQQQLVTLFDVAERGQVSPRA